MLRCLFTVLSAVSLLLCAAVVALGEYAEQARGLTDDQLIAAVELADHPNDPLDLGSCKVPYLYAMTAEVLRRAGEDPGGRSLGRGLADSGALEEATRTLPPEQRRTVRRSDAGRRIA